MAATNIGDIESVETEHLLGAATDKGLVTLRVTSTGTERRTMLVGQLDPAAAREIAVHLFESAARAEYEQDLHAELRRAGMDDATITLILFAVRKGEFHRHTAGDPQ